VMRLIDADGSFTLNSLYNTCYSLAFGGGIISFVDNRSGKVVADFRAEDAPTIDAEPVKHSEWKYYHKKGVAVCKNCSFERDLNTDFGRAVSCPNCGAKMEVK